MWVSDSSICSLHKSESAADLGMALNLMLASYKQDSGLWTKENQIIALKNTYAFYYKFCDISLKDEWNLGFVQNPCEFGPEITVLKR